MGEENRSAAYGQREEGKGVEPVRDAHEKTVPDSIADNLGSYVSRRLQGSNFRHSHGRTISWGNRKLESYGMRLRQIIFAILLLSFSAQAQEKPKPEFRVTGGWVGFIDESWIAHGAVGGSVRYYLTKRIAVEP